MQWHETTKPYTTNTHSLRHKHEKLSRSDYFNISRISVFSMDGWIRFFAVPRSLQTEKENHWIFPSVGSFLLLFVYIHSIRDVFFLLDGSIGKRKTEMQKYHFIIIKYTTRARALRTQWKGIARTAQSHKNKYLFVHFLLFVHAYICACLPFSQRPTQLNRCSVKIILVHTCISISPAHDTRRKWRKIKRNGILSILPLFLVSHKHFFCFASFWLHFIIC